jgi:hypothetical protein
MSPAGIAYSDAVPQPGMQPSHYVSDYERFAAAWHAAHCTVEDCDRCRYLCDEGLVVGCDECSKVHHTDWLGWDGTLGDDGCVVVRCPECVQKELIRNMLGTFKVSPLPVYRLSV